MAVVDTEYEACACSPVGKIKRVSQPYAPGAPIYWTTYTYDGLGRTLSVTAPDGASTTTYTYQGNVTTVTDPAGKWKRFTTNARGNLVKVTEPNPAGGQWETHYTYDGRDLLVQVSMTRDGVTQVRTFEYNGIGWRLSRATNPENGTVTYTYHPGGMLASRTDAKNQRVEYSYDSQQRLTQIRRFGPGQQYEDLSQRVDL